MSALHNSLEPRVAGLLERVATALWSERTHAQCAEDCISISDLNGLTYHVRESWRGNASARLALKELHQLLRPEAEAA